MRQTPLLALAALFAAACSGTRLAAPSPEPRAPRPAVIRGTPAIPSTWTLKATPVTAPHAMVVTAHPVATQAGVEILQQGGNAIDAAIAVAFALEVVYPVAGNIGGGGFIVHRTAAGEVAALDYREAAPSNASRDMYVDSAGNVTDKSRIGHLAAGVPGSVAGLHAAWKRYGSLPWATLLAPAIRLAQGHVIDTERSRNIAADRELLAQFPASRTQFLPGDSAPPPGTVWRQPDLARTLQLISDSGPDVFYRGQVADLIVAEMQRGGGLITKDDLRRYRPKWRTPIQLRYRGYTIYSMPPPSSGGVTMGEILNIMEGYDTLPAFGRPDYVHVLAEAMRRGFIDRNRWLGDPDFVAMPLDRLLSKSYAATLRSQIDPRHATPTPATTSGDGMNTTHYSIVDAHGNAAAVTTTLNGGFGSGVTVTGAGFLLNNEMDDFTSAPGKPNMYGLVQGEANAIQPGKRMLSAMTPSIVLDNSGQLELVVGTPGGPTIITSVVQVILDVLDQGMDLSAAMAAPRMHHQALPDVIRYEDGGFSDATLQALRAMGHRLEAWRGRQGLVEAIQRTAGGWVGVTDPRSAGGAAGY